MSYLNDNRSNLLFPEEEALQKRVELSGDDSFVRGMFFVNTLEMLRRLTNEKTAEEVRSQSALAHEDCSAMRKYAMRHFLELEALAAQRLTDMLGGFDEGVAAMGAGTVEIFFDSVAGRTMKLLAGRDPHRMMSAAPNGYMLAVSDNAVREYQKTGERSGVFTFQRDCLGPCHNLGVFHAAITACEVTPHIRLEQSSLVDFRFLVSW